MSKKIVLKLALTELATTIIEAVVAGVLDGLRERSNIVRIEPDVAVVRGERVHITDEAPKGSRQFEGWWSKDEDDIARDPELSDEDVAELTGRQVHNVHSYRLHHRYIEPSRSRTVTPVERAMARWTEAETAYVVEEFEDKGTDWQVIADAIGRTRAACRTQYRRATGKPIPSTRR